MATIASLVVRIGADISNFEQNMTQMQRSMRIVGDKLTSVGKTMTASVTAPLAGLGIAAVVTGAKFDEQMSKVKAITGATGKEFDALREQAMELGATTQFSASQAAEGMEFLARAGWKTEQIMAAMPGMLDLAAAAAMDLGTAADITSNIMTGFSINASEAGHVADVLAYAAANANTDVEQMGYAMKYLAPVADSMGWSLEQTTAAVMAFAEQGIRGEQAGAAFSTSIQRMTKPTGEAKKIMDELGMSFFDSQGKMKPLVDVVKELETKTAGMTDQQKAATLTTLFGAEAYKHWNTLLKTGSKELDTMSTNLEKSDGFAEKTAKTMNNNLMGAFRSLISAIENMAIQFNDVFEPVIRRVAEIITSLTRKFADIPTTAKVVIGIFAAIVAAIGPLLVIAGMLISAISTVGAAIGAVGAGPILIAIGAIAALVAIGVALWKNWETIRAKAKPIFEGIKQAIAPLVGSIKGSFQTLMDSVGPIWESLKRVFESLKPVLMDIAMVVGGALVVQFGVMISVINAVISALGPLINSIINAVEVIINVIMALVSVFTGDLDKAWEYVQKAGQATLDSLKNLFEAIKNLVVTLVRSIVNFFMGLYNTLVGNSIIPDMVNAIIKWFQNLGKMALDKVKAMVKWVIGAFEGLFPGFSKVMDSVKNVIFTAWNAIQTVFRTYVNLVKTIVSGDFSQVQRIISDVMSKAQSKIKNIWNGIKSFLSSVNLFTVGKNIIQGLLNGINNMAGKVLNKAQEIANGVKNKIKSALRIASPSKVMLQYGEWTGEGFAIGLERTIADIAAGAGLMAQAAVPDVDTPRTIGLRPLPMSQTATGMVEPQIVAPEYVVVKIGAHEIVRAIAPEMGREQYRIARERNRSVGRERIR